MQGAETRKPSFDNELFHAVERGIKTVDFPEDPLIENKIAKRAHQDVKAALEGRVGRLAGIPFSRRRLVSETIAAARQAHARDLAGICYEIFTEISGDTKEPLTVYVTPFQLPGTVDVRDARVAVLPYRGDSLDLLFQVAQSTVSQSGVRRYAVDKKGKFYCAASGFRFVESHGEVVGGELDKSIVACQAVVLSKRAVAKKSLIQPEIADAHNKRVKEFEKSWEQMTTGMPSQLLRALEGFRIAYPGDLGQDMVFLMRKGSDGSFYLEKSVAMQFIFGSMLERVLAYPDASFGQHEVFNYFSRAYLTAHAGKTGHDKLMRYRRQNDLRGILDNLDLIAEKIPNVYFGFLSDDFDCQKAKDETVANMLEALLVIEKYYLSRREEQGLALLTDGQGLADAERAALEHAQYGDAGSHLLESFIKLVSDPVLPPEYARQFRDSLLVVVENLKLEQNQGDNWRESYIQALNEMTSLINRRVVQLSAQHSMNPNPMTRRQLETASLVVEVLTAIKDNGIAGARKMISDLIFQDDKEFNFDVSSIVERCFLQTVEAVAAARNPSAFLEERRYPPEKIGLLRVEIDRMRQRLRINGRVSRYWNQITNSLVEYAMSVYSSPTGNYAGRSMRAIEVLSHSMNTEAGINKSILELFIRLARRFGEQE